MQLTTWYKQMKFTEKMCHRWSIVTFQQKQKPMSLYEFKLQIEFAGYDTFYKTKHINKLYNIYLNDLEKQKSK